MKWQSYFQKATRTRAPVATSGSPGHPSHCGGPPKCSLRADPCQGLSKHFLSPQFGTCVHPDQGDALCSGNSLSVLLCILWAVGCSYLGRVWAGSLQTRGAESAGHARWLQKCLRVNVYFLHFLLLLSQARNWVNWMAVVTPRVPLMTGILVTIVSRSSTSCCN